MRSQYRMNERIRLLSWRTVTALILGWLLLWVACPSFDTCCVPTPANPNSDYEPSHYNGLHPTDFGAIFVIDDPEREPIYVGLNAEPTGEMAGVVVVGQRPKVNFQGRISTDPKDRWLTMDWEIDDPACRSARYHARVWWADLKAVTGRAAVQCSCSGTEPITTWEAPIRLLYDSERTKEFNLSLVLKKGREE